MADGVITENMNLMDLLLAFPYLKSLRMQDCKIDFLVVKPYDSTDKPSIDLPLEHLTIRRSSMKSMMGELLF